MTEGPGRSQRDRSGAPELSVIVPTHNRQVTLLKTLQLLERDAAELPIEIVVADDGSTDGTRGALERMGKHEGRTTRFVRLAESQGPGAARNRAVEVARGSACLFLGDDIRPREGLLERHLEFHRRRPERTAAMLGRTVPAPPLDRSPFIRWLHEEGKQFAYAALAEGTVRSRYFYTSNASAKTELIRSVGGFDEQFGVGHDDVELALRMDTAGMQLHYDPAALAEHYHPTDLQSTLDRVRSGGHSYRLLVSVAPGQWIPRRPGLRHRLKAAALAAPGLLGIRGQRLRSATWHFLCDEAWREAFWQQPAPPGEPVRIGRFLARSALRDPQATPPATAP